MKMKFSIMVLLLLETCYCTSVSLSSTCTCTTIQIQPDCIQMDGCEWDSSTNKCVKNPTVSYYSQLCSSITDQTKCVKQYGCAYVNKACVIFGDCISYVATSNSDCQKFSLRCNYKPSKSICTEDDVCGEYNAEDKQTECASVLQRNGDGLCIYDTTGKVCRKKICSDYLKTTADDCKNVIQDQICITDKKTCVDVLKACSSYSFDECLSIKAINDCEVTTGDSPKCQDRTCEGATDQFKTKDQCSIYKSGCKFNGSTCVSQLASCTSQTSNCTNMIGNVGQCQANADKCRDPVCTDYTFTTDKECQDANLGLKCITNGAGCVAQLDDNCTNIQISQCPNAKSKKGLCKLNDTQDKCIDNTCTMNLGTQDSDCSKYSSTCVSNGVECVEGLPALCSGITASNGQTCSSYHAKEGKCKPPASGTTCALDACANQNLTTNDLCKPYSSNDNSQTIVCVTNGVKCLAKASLTQCSAVTLVEGQTCSQYIGSDGRCIDDANNSGKCTVTACNAIVSPASEQDCETLNTVCKFDGIGCVAAKQTCDKYTNDCDKVITSDGSSCVLDSTSTKCIVKTCDTAPSSNNTDELCIAYLSGCKTNGNGCTSALKDCKSHKGTLTTCEKYIGTDGHCTGDATNTDSSPCTSKICSNSKTANEQACQAYSNKCLYSALLKQCLPYVNQCTQISKQADCEYNLTLAEGRLCLWQNNQCITAQCNFVNKSGSAEVCAIFGSNCQFDNISGCYDKTSYPCAALRSRQTCTVDSSGLPCVWDVNQKLCFNFSKCEDYSLPAYLTNQSATIPKTAQQITDETKLCKSISDKCYSDGSYTLLKTANCVPQKPCTQFKDPLLCLQQTDYNDGKTKCGYDSVKTQCIKFGTCTDLQLTTHTECQQLSATCTSNGTSCTAITTCADFTQEDGCNQGGTDGKCFWNEGKCSKWTCVNSQFKTFQTCQAQSTACATDGTKCIAIASCSSYAVGAEAGCSDNVGLKDKLLVPCFYDIASSKCREKVCSDNVNQIDQSHCLNSNCGYDSDKKQCIDIVACNKYTTQAQCQIGMTNNVIVPCVYDSTTKVCRDKTCEDYTNIANKNDCVAHNCGFDADNKKCVTLGLCKTYTTQTICNNNQGQNYTCLWSTVGTTSSCAEIKGCADASTSQIACLARAGCSFIPANTTANTQSQCKDSTCQTFNYGKSKLTGCSPVVSADQKTLTFCGWSDKDNSCVETDSSVYDQTSCFTWTKYTYYWDKTKLKCTSCSSSGTSGNNSTSTNGTNSSTADSYANILKQVILYSLLTQLV